MNVDIKNNIKNIKEKVSILLEERKDKNLTIMGVTKKKPYSYIVESVKNKIFDIGENYVQEALKKIEDLKKTFSEEEFKKINMHFIGSLQTNKIKYLKDFSFIHSIYKEKHIKEILKRFDKKINIFLEVNVGNEVSKSGISFEGLNYLIEYILKNDKNNLINLKGLMCMPSFSNTKEESRKDFERVRLAKDKLNEKFKINMKDLSMGMSSDFDVAIKEGATFIRLGTILYGKREK
jgi:PLP dependent protein